MDKDPYNVVLRAGISILIILGIYVGGSWLLQLRDQSELETPNNTQPEQTF